MNRKNEPSLAPAARARDPIFDSVASVCGIEQSDLTTSARGSLNRAVKDLKAAGATPEEVEHRASNYLASFDAMLTPAALAKWWPQLGNGGPPTGNGKMNGNDDMAKLKASLGGETK